MKIGKVELILLFTLAILTCCILAALGQTFLAGTKPTGDRIVTEQVQPIPATDTPQTGGIRVGANDLQFFTRSKWAYSWTEQTYGDGWRYIGQSSNGNQKITLWTESGEADNLATVRFTFRFPLDGDETIRQTGVSHLVDTIHYLFEGWTESDQAWLVDMMGKPPGEYERVRGDVTLSLSLGQTEGEYLVIFEVGE